jgi:predicted dehydrogenase
MGSKSRLGIIGCGAVAQINYLPGLAYFDEVHLARVHDLNLDAASRLAAASGAEVSSLEQILDDCEVVVVATPPASHAVLVEKCLSDGRIVICEKPFVGTKADAQRLADLAAERHSKLFVGHLRRCYPSVRLGRALIASGILGQITAVSAYEGGRFTWPVESGYVHTDPFGGVLFDTGSHTVDMLLYVAGLDSGDLQVTAVETQRDCPEPSNDLEARVSLSRDGRGISGHLKFSRFMATANKLRVECENGFLEIPTGLANYVRIGGPAGSAVTVHARESYSDVMDCFAVQLKRMFWPDEEHTFAAEKFINLSGVLEAVSNGG